MVMPSEDAGPRRVVITGIGAVTPAGPTAPDYWGALVAGRVCTGPITAFEPGRPAAAGMIAGYEPPAGVPERLLSRLDRGSVMALDAAIQAIGDARIAFNAENAFAVGAIIGSAHPGGEGWAALSAGLASTTVGLSIAGPSFAVQAGAASGLAAICTAAGMIRGGAVRAALAGGTDALEERTWRAYERAGLLDPGEDPEAQRPFDARRRGMVPGEGAAVLLLEDRQLATQRGARIYAEIAGEAMTAGPPGDGQPPTDVEIARRAIGNALRNAGISPQTVDAVFTGGAGLPEGDARETDILERAFGIHIRDMYITAASPATGHALGASGALGALAAAISVSEGVVPPHATFGEADPACGLDIAERAREDRLAAVIASAYGSHGENAAVVLARHRAAAGDELQVIAE